MIGHSAKCRYESGSDDSKFTLIPLDAYPFIVRLCVIFSFTSSVMETTQSQWADGTLLVSLVDHQAAAPPHSSQRQQQTKGWLPAGEAFVIAHHILVESKFFEARKEYRSGFALLLELVTKIKCRSGFVLMVGCSMLQKWLSAPFRLEKSSLLLDTRFDGITARPPANKAHFPAFVSELEVLSLSLIAQSGK